MTTEQIEALEDEAAALDMKDEEWTEADIARIEEISRLLGAA